MGPRLRFMWLLIAGGCAMPPTGEAEVLAEMLNSSQASRAALAPPASSPPPPNNAPSPPLVALSAQPAGTHPGSTAHLMGAAPDALLRWLGEPNLRRPEGGAEIWLYAGQDCALDLILYRQGGGLRVAHASARASGTTSRTEGACLAQLSAAAASRATPAAATAQPRRRPGA